MLAKRKLKSFDVYPMTELLINKRLFEILLITPFGNPVSEQ